MSEIQKHLIRLLDHEDLSQEEMSRVMQMILLGGASSIQIASIASAIQTKTPSYQELYSVINLMRRKIRVIEGHDDVMNIAIAGNLDVNHEIISLIVMFILASLDSKTSKYLNKISSSASDIVTIAEKLRFNLFQNTDSSLRTLEESNISILFSQQHMHVFREIIQVMQDLSFYGIFDIANSLISPVNCSYYLIGVPDYKLARPLAEAMDMFGTKSAWIINSQGLGGIVSANSKTKVLSLREGAISEFELNPADFNFSEEEDLDIEKKDIYLEDGEENSFYADQIYKFLKSENKNSHFKKIVLMNSAAAIMARGITNNFEDSIRIAREAVQSGNALMSMQRYVNASNME